MEDIELYHSIPQDIDPKTNTSLHCSCEKLQSQHYAGMNNENHQNLMKRYLEYIEHNSPCRALPVNWQLKLEL